MRARRGSRRFSGLISLGFKSRQTRLQAQTVLDSHPMASAGREAMDERWFVMLIRVAGSLGQVEQADSRVWCGVQAHAIYV